MVSIIQLLNISWAASSRGRAHQNRRGCESDRRCLGNDSMPVCVSSPGICRSACAPTAENDPNGSDEDDHVKPGGLFAGVDRIETYTPVIVEIISTADLPQPGYARRALVIGSDPAAIALDFLGKDRPRSDQAHVALQYIEQLRKLVQARAAQKRTEPGHTRVVCQLAGIFPFLPGGGVSLQ